MTNKTAITAASLHYPEITWDLENKELQVTRSDAVKIYAIEGRCANNDLYFAEYWIYPNCDGIIKDIELSA